MTSKLKTDVLETVSGSGTIALTNQLSGMTSASMPSGSVLQVVNNSLRQPTGGLLTSSTSYVATDLAATITPSATSSKILVIINGNVDTEAANNQGNFTIYRGSSNVIDVAGFIAPYSASGRMIVPMSITHYDSPSTTNATTYTLYMRSYAGNIEFNSQGITSTITLMEIKG